MSDEDRRQETPTIDERGEIEPQADDAGRPAGDDGDGPESRSAAEPEEEIAELQDRLLRKQAELINYRRRVEREREDLLDRGRSRVLRELLPVVDDFERAVESEPGDLEAYREGVEMILRSLRETLRKLGVERIDPLDEAFDPRYHEAVERRPVRGAAEGTVVDVYQPGYRLGERLLRPASVVVAGAGYGGGSGSGAEGPPGEDGETASDAEPGNQGEASGK